MIIPTGQLVYGQGASKFFNSPDKFRQLHEVLRAPNAQRTASGAPGPQYWQQNVDYVIDVEIDDENQHLIGSETIQYTNQSPHTLTYLWLQLDANIREPDSKRNLTETRSALNSVTHSQLRRMLAQNEFDGGVDITAVEDAAGQPLPYQIVETNMRVDLPYPLKQGDTFIFSVDWNYAINDADSVSGRSGCEFFEEDGNYIYEMAQWFPRLCAYTDYAGWQNKDFIGYGEFTLEFGDYLVRITVPEDHVVASTGVLMNPEEVLTREQRTRLRKAENANSPVFVITPEEAEENEQSRAAGKKTWIFEADNVRDFAFATSRKYIWDAWGVDIEGRNVMAMSFYPNEGEPLWSRYSTHAVAHALEVYSKFTFPYPYPVAISVNGPVGGMEYPMITFNGPRPEPDGTYSENTKRGLISVIIHEVGHNWFPMIVNSDERQWMWMDEGLNSFVQFLAEQEWVDEYESWRGEPHKMRGYMATEHIVPIMTQADSVLQLGNNAYGKPATALNVLRETILGRELFDFAFKEYAQRWKFKRPTPADLFRTLEDASGVDLDWFWRGWFYTTDHCDIAIDDLRQYVLSDGDPREEKERRRQERQEEPESISDIRNEPLPKRVEEYPELQDFYTHYDALDVTEQEIANFEQRMEQLSEEERENLKTDYRFYIADFSNIGGLVMPIIFDIHYQDGSQEEMRLPAEIWRRDADEVSKLLMVKKPIERIVVDPHRETADADLSNNVYPPRIDEQIFRVRKGRDHSNPMRDVGLGRNDQAEIDARDDEERRDTQNMAEEEVN